MLFVSQISGVVDDARGPGYTFTLQCEDVHVPDSTCDAITTDTVHNDTVHNDTVARSNRQLMVNETFEKGSAFDVLAYFLGGSSRIWFKWVR